MKKLTAIILIALTAVVAVSCANGNEENEDETIFTNKSKATVTETEKESLKLSTETVKEEKNKAATDASEKPQKPKKRRTESETESTTATESSEPPTQGRTRPNTRVTVYVEKGSFKSSDLDFYYDGSVIALGDLMDDALAVLGEEDAVSDISKTRTEYSFDGFSIVSYKSGGEEYIERISINSEDIPTSKNAVIGMYATRLRRLYGDPTKTASNAYIYTKGKANLIFYYEDNIVNEICYKLTL